MDDWEELYRAAAEVQRPRALSPLVEAGGVAAALRTKGGRICVGVCIDTACGLGMCAERAAAASTLITHGEHQIDKILALMPDGRVGPPCGACREFLMQLGPESGETEILLDLEGRKTVRLKELMPGNPGGGRSPKPRDPAAPESGGRTAWRAPGAVPRRGGAEGAGAGGQTTGRSGWVLFALICGYLASAAVMGLGGLDEICGTEDGPCWGGS